MNQIILCRHASTQALEDLEGSGKVISKRQNDSPLSLLGQKEAENMKKLLKKTGYRWDAVLCSMFTRTRETGAIINKDAKKPLIVASEFNEYYVSPEGKDLESTKIGTARAMTKLYALFQVFDSVLLVGHKSINQTILRNLLNCTYKTSLKYFHKTMETVVLRYNWRLGDNKWKIIDHFTV